MRVQYNFEEFLSCGVPLIEILEVQIPGFPEMANEGYEPLWKAEIHRRGWRPFPADLYWSAGVAGRYSSRKGSDVKIFPPFFRAWRSDGRDCRGARC